ncbi:MAG: hypothetical protein HYY93_09170 [Planctomycetes bacterium]|nr:hypothetical protein [Planctomycetota bacterium]
MRRNGMGRWTIGILTALLLTAASSAQAATITWSGGSSSSWTDAGNWDFGVPTSGDDVVINDGAGFVIEFDDFSAPTFASLTVNSATGILDTFGNSMTISGDLILSADTMEINSGSLIQVMGNVSVASGAQLILNDGTFQAAGILGWGGGNGDFLMSAGTTVLLLDGVSPQTLPASSGGTPLVSYADLTIDNGDPSGVTLGGDVMAENVTINTGKTLTVPGGVILTLNGSMDWGSGGSGGNFNMSAGSTLTLAGVGQVAPFSESGAPNVQYADVSITGTGAFLSGSYFFDSLGLAPGADATLSSGNVTVSGATTVSSGATLTLNAGDILIAEGTLGWFGALGTLTMNAGSLLILGAGAASSQTLPAGSYADVEIANPNGVTIDGSVSLSNLTVENNASFDTSLFDVTVSGCVFVPPGDSGTLILQVPSGSPAPPNDNFAVQAFDLALGDGATPGTTLILQGDGRLNLQQLTVALNSTLMAHQGGPGNYEDAAIDVSGDILIDGTYDAGSEGKMVMGGPLGAAVNGNPVTFFNLQLGKTSPVTVDFNVNVTVGGFLGINGSTNLSANFMLETLPAGVSQVELSDTSGATVNITDLSILGNTVLLGTGASTWDIFNGFTVAPGATLDLDTGNTVTLLSSISGTAIDGTLLLNGSTLDVQSFSASLDVNPGGLLDMGTTGRIDLNAPVGIFVSGTLDGGMGGILTINDSSGYLDANGGTLQTPVGGSPVFQSGSPGTIPLNVYISGAGSVLNLESGTFVGLGSSGLFIGDQTSIPALNNVTFASTMPGGRHICIQRNESGGALTLTWSNLVMDDSFGPGSGFNIEATNIGSSTVTIDVTTSSGVGTGDADESENGPIVILWTGGGGGSPPFIFGIAPGFGNTSGGDFIEIEGMNFDGAASVFFSNGGGSAPATGVTVVNSSLITCSTPSFSPGSAALVISQTSGSDSHVFFFSTPSSVAGSVTGGSSVNDYRMISIPGFITNEEAFEALELSLGSHDPSQWRVFMFDPSGFYDELTPGSIPDPDETFTGRAVWLISRNSSSISANTLTTAPTSDLHQFYDAGWNQIGNPYTVDVSWGSVMVQDLDPSTGNPNGSPAPATSSPIIDNTLYYWNGVEYVSSSILEPGEGYWMFNAAGHEIELEVPNPGGAAKPLIGPVHTPLQAPSVPPPPPPGGVLSSGGGSAVSSGGSSSGASGATSFSSSGSSSGTGGGGGGGGGGGCWVERSEAARFFPLPILAMLLLGLTVMRRRAS